MNEVSVDVGDKTTEIARVIERVQTPMATHYGTIKQESKFKEKVKALRTQIQKRMTEIQARILEMVEEDPGSDETISKVRLLNTEML